MTVSGKQELTPQTEEDIHEIKWVKKNELNKYFENTYPSVKEVLEILLNS
jgi:hypothetical protein